MANINRKGRELGEGRRVPVENIEKLIRRLRSGDVEHREILFSAFADYFLTTREMTLSPTSWEHCRLTIQKYLEPHFIGIQMADITPQMIVDLMKSFEEREVLPATQVYVLRVLATILRSAASN